MCCRESSTLIFVWPIIAHSVNILGFQKLPTGAEQTRDRKQEARLPVAISGLFWDFRLGQEENPSPGKHFSALAPPSCRPLAEESSFTSPFLHSSVSTHRIQWGTLSSGLSLKAAPVCSSLASYASCFFYSIFNTATCNHHLTTALFTLSGA